MPHVDWTKDPTGAYDTLYLGGRRVPGVAQVDITLPSGIDVQKPKGGKRATIKDEGTPPAELKIRIKLLPEEMDEFDQIRPMLRPRSKNGARDPLEIAHPQARDWGINVITVGPIDDPHPPTGGAKIISFTAFEWAKGPDKVKKPKAKPKTTAKPGLSASWDVEPLIKDLSPGAAGAAGKNFSEEPPNFTPGGWFGPNGPVKGIGEGRPEDSIGRATPLGFGEWISGP